MYVCILALPLCSPVFPAKKRGFSSVFAKRTSKNIEFFQIFGKRMQEAQASNKAGRGNRAWDPCFATPAPRRLRLVERHQIAARYVGDPPPKKTYVIDVGRGGVWGGGYPLSSSKYPTRRAMSADMCIAPTSPDGPPECVRKHAQGQCFERLKLTGPDQVCGAEVWGWAPKCAPSAGIVCAGFPFFPSCTQASLCLQPAMYTSLAGKTWNPKILKP